MLALKLIRENTAGVLDGLHKLNATAPIDEILEADRSDEGSHAG